jgi:hypothetical protein
VALWDLFKKKREEFKKKREEHLNPESRWALSLQDGAIELTIPDGESQCVQLNQLTGVAVETNDTGPWGADVWWVLFGKDDKVAVAFPQGSTGEKGVVDTLMALPGFDHQAMINAMRCTTNQVFSVWRAPGR